jgi:hypothetical protein
VVIGNSENFSTPSGYKYFLNTSRSLSEAGGIFTVTENGEVTLHGGEFSSFAGRDDSGIFNKEIGFFADDGDDFEIATGDAFFRCSGLYRNHSYLIDAQYTTDDSGSFDTYPLYPIPTQVSTQIQSGANKASYSVTFTNDPKISGTYDTGTFETNLYRSLEYNHSLSRDEQGIVSITDNGTWTFHRPNHAMVENEAAITNAQSSTFKGFVDGSSLATEEVYNQYLKTENEADYNILNANRVMPLKLTQTSLSCPRYGKQFTYTKTYSNSPEFADLDFTKITINISDNAPITKKSQHLIPNYKEIVHHGFFEQTEFGSRSISISAQIARPPSNVFSNPLDFDFYINKLLDKARDKAKETLIDVDKLIIQDLWITNCDYKLGHDSSIEMSVEVQYTAARTKTNINPVISYE